VLGFGAMRLPLAGEDPAIIDETSTTKMLRYAIDNGVNYLDIGYSYDISYQESMMRVLSRALGDGYREKIKIAVTVPVRIIDSPADFDRCVEEQLGWLDTDRIDFCILGGLNRMTWPEMRELDIPGRAEKAMAAGKFDRLGFFFHDYFQALRSVVEEYDNWSLCEFQYSYMDIDHHPGYGGLKFAADNGLAVIATEPHLGGRLTRKPPESVSKVWESTAQNRTQSEWALRWVWNHPEVSTVVSNMSTIEQLAENIALAGDTMAESLTVQEQVLVSRVRDAYRQLKAVPCTACRACMPCPQDIDVPRIFEIYNEAVMYGDMESARSLYRNEKHRIENCNACGSCVNACGRSIPILDWLDTARERLVEGR